jgi:hypothetical protein
MRFPEGWRASFVCLAMTIAWLNGISAAAQTLPTTQPDPCPTAEAITPAHLFGLWQLVLGSPEKPGGEGELTFKRHPEFPGSVRGTLVRSAQGTPFRAQVAGDVTDQGFQLEESADGVTIDAVWSGEVLRESCGRAIGGWRRVVEGDSPGEALSEQPFVLKKTPDWR